ncbi:GNAT family N-acetyltransferase [Vibrio splendidus]|uniref:N-acetyltransferase domain-containing protein n=1 Tax=Vibrio splendidus TaxID=29497 RepID=A0A2N7JWT3_VIBSP|nr:GNAT family N-acetyltransferase [Vibrio splendidus]PMM64342.1 hypothetical protein BCT54_17655 [Vibrio splendidus]
MIFETERLYARSLKKSDFHDFHELQSDDEVMKYVTGHGLSKEENLKQLTATINRYSEVESTFLVWAVVNKCDDSFIGTCAIIGGKNCSEIGYRFLKHSWGNGFGKEICNGLISYAKSHEYKQLKAYVESGNDASIQILEQSALCFFETSSLPEGTVEHCYQWCAE